MARRRYTIDEKRAAKFAKEGRGQGHGKDYKPWLTIQDVPSTGLSHRLMGITTGREHHYLSNLEHDLFILLDWQRSTIDLREQFPLDLDATQDIAERVHIRHPQAPHTIQPMVMTTDLVQDRRGVHGTETVTYAVKTAEDLENARTLQKLEIEWRYWQELGTPWTIVTRAELPKNLIDNINWVHNFFHPIGLDDRLLALTPNFLDDISAGSSGSLGSFCAAFDQHHNLLLGSALLLTRHILATRMASCDMEMVLLNDSLSMAALSVDPSYQRNGRA